LNNDYSDKNDCCMKTHFFLIDKRLLFLVYPFEIGPTTNLDFSVSGIIILFLTIFSLGKNGSGFFRYHYFPLQASSHKTGFNYVNLGWAPTN